MKRFFSATTLLALVACNRNPTAVQQPRPGDTGTAGSATSSVVVMVDAGNAPIGSAILTDVGALQLDMWSPAHARLVYPRSSPDYLEVRRHIEAHGGAMVVGKERTFPPFPEAELPASSVLMDGRVALGVLDALASRTAQDADCTLKDGKLQVAFVEPRSARAGLRVPKSIVEVLAQARDIVRAEHSDLVNYAVDGHVDAGIVTLTLVPNVAPGEAYHPGGRTSLGPEMTLTFASGMLQRKQYAR
jgi:hypothetical protein